DRALGRPRLPRDPRRLRPHALLRGAARAARSLGGGRLPARAPALAARADRVAAARLPARRAEDAVSVARWAGVLVAVVSAIVLAVAWAASPVRAAHAWLVAATFAYTLACG